MTCMTHHSHSIYSRYIYIYAYIKYSPSWILSSYHWNNYTLNHFISKKMLRLRPSNLDQYRTMVQCIHIVLLPMHKSACQLASRNLSSMCKDSGKHQDMPREWPFATYLRRYIKKANNEQDSKANLKWSPVSKHSQPPRWNWRFDEHCMIFCQPTPQYRQQKKNLGTPFWGKSQMTFLRKLPQPSGILIELFLYCW